jgi:ribonucleotide monophosphatase NagD (HAD superfamily)
MKIFGKPEIETYRFTEQHCEGLFGKIGKYVMIGDNP